MEPIKDHPISCSLSSAAASEQVAEWHELRAKAVGVEVIESGMKMTVPVALADTVKDLARRERACCSFLSIETRGDGDTFVVEMTSTNPAAAVVIKALVGDDAS